MLKGNPSGEVYRGIPEAHVIFVSFSACASYQNCCLQLLMDDTEQVRDTLRRVFTRLLPPKYGRFNFKENIRLI